MAPFYPIYISRSDGKVEIRGPGSRVEINRPTPEQMSQEPLPDTKDFKDYYVKLEDADPKAIDWRRKLAAMLVRALPQTQHQGKNWILAALPENYQLYEHKKAKGTDAYLYGHPTGRKKRFRSPGDFFPHLLWLVTDSTGDQGNCTCKMCAPDDIQDLAKIYLGTQSEAKRESGIKDEPSRPTSAKSSVIGKNPSVVIPKRSTSQGAESISKPSVFSKSTPSSTIPTPALPTPIAPPRCREQALDAQYNQFLFRVGEVVWFSRGSAWGLSVVTMREENRQYQGQISRRYVVQPLSHPFSHAEPKIIQDESLLRPWLAWSAPNPTHDSLNGPGLNYDTVDWGAVVQGLWGPGDAEVDGSIFAAKIVDASYTLFDQIDDSTLSAGETSWTGIFLGGEKIWVGEPVRLRVGNGTSLMIVHQIIEKTTKGFGTTPTTQNVSFIGDIYAFSTTVVHAHQPSPAEIPTTLPPRLRTDLLYRNKYTIDPTQTVATSKFITALSRLPLADIKGRWYESTLLLPLLRGPRDWAQDVARGEIGDAGMWMNGRLEMNRIGNTTGTKAATRKAAFRSSVPSSMRLSQGLDGPPEEDRFPRSASASRPMPNAAMEYGGELEDAAAAATGPEQSGEAGLEYFMDLDATGEVDGLMGMHVNQYEGADGQFFGDAMG
ncbi:MAG: hypothetical protein M1817_005379 [Caeruleum heppii]|nr:MAG: hypothetical protein M1817_005379 [Caeruleum heppii]